MVSSPSKENRSSQPQLGLPSCLPCWFRVPSCPDLFCVLVCYKREMMLQLPRGSLAPSFCPLVHLDRSCSGLESTWCSRSRKAIPAISWDIPLALAPSQKHRERGSHLSFYCPLYLPCFREKSLQSQTQAKVFLPAWGGGFGFVLLLLLTTSDRSDFPACSG